MLNTRKITPGILGTIVVLFLYACGTSTLVEPPTVTPTPTLTPDIYLMGDCWHSIRVAAWQDLDRDGLWGVSEPPLEGVKFDIRGPIAEIDSPILLSKTDGRLDIEVYHPGKCFAETYTLTAYPPDSYEPTTPASLTFSLNPDETFYEVQFGFRAVSKE
jgi:hypothetical protein